MNESSITIRWEKNPDGSSDISVSGDKDYQLHFREAFLPSDSFKRHLRIFCFPKNTRYFCLD